MIHRRPIVAATPLAALALAPFVVMACSPSSSQPAAAPTASAAPPPPGYATGAPPRGYPGYAPAGTYPQQPPPGYATAAPPPGYATAAPPPGYATQPPPAAPPPAVGAAQPPPAAYPPAGYPASSPPPTAPATASSSAPSGPLAPTDPNSLQGILAGLQGALQGTLVAPGSVPTDLTEAGLKTQALRFAPGMQPEGQELKQQLNEGQHAVVMLTLQAGKCYTVVGFSPLGGVKDLDLNLLAPPLYLTLAGQDLTHNNMPTIGASPSPMCPVLAFPLQYKLDVFARSGSGQVAVQLYSKNKS